MVAGAFSFRVSNNVSHTMDNARSGKVASRFSTPTVSSVVQNPMPKHIRAEDVCVRVTDALDQQSRDRGDDFLLATNIASDLSGHIQGSACFAFTEDTAKLVFEIEVTSASIGSRWNRCWKGDTGFVRLGIAYAIYDRTQEGRPILKHGKVVYVDPLKDSNLKGRCNKNSGELSMTRVLPVVSRQLVNEVLVDAAYTSTELA